MESGGPSWGQGVVELQWGGLGTIRLQAALVIGDGGDKDLKLGTWTHRSSASQMCLIP